MHSHAKFFLLLSIAPLAAERIETAPAQRPYFHYQIAGDAPGSWPAILSSIGLSTGGAEGSGVIYVVTASATPDPKGWRERVEQGAIVILEGGSALAREFGFVSKGERPQAVRNLMDTHNPKLGIIWEKVLDLEDFHVPATARIFTRERWRGAPLVAGLKQGAGAVLWVAAPPGPKGHERFPYLTQALTGLGMQPPFRSRRLWAFFDASYRSRVDMDYFAARWRKSGIAALHVAAWHFFGPNPERAAYLKALIEACHRQSILVYAWLELPHVSEQFWQDHPEWREKTALGQDAHLDWRKLMNLQNPAAAGLVEQGVRSLLQNFDWDGVNLAELYFESLEGHSNGARFTPMNSDARAQFSAAHGFDPIEIFSPGSPRHHSREAASLRVFLDWRADLARRMQEEWIARLETIRATRPHLDLVLTHVDDRYDTGMRDLIGADAARLLPLQDRHDFTFLIEDPATLWHLGPERYTDIAARYAPLSLRPQKLAIDINIVERYQDVYPTKQQTGTELFQLVNLASRAFPRVALYFENSLLAPDLPLLASSAAAPDRVEWAGSRLAIESRRGLGLPWKGPALVDGRPWPIADDATVWLPPGAHAVEPATAQPTLRVLDFSGEIKTAFASANTVELAYVSDSRALAILDHPPVGLEIDGAQIPPQTERTPNGWLLRLPRGHHLVLITR
ncbi:MAG: hypothetical protein JJE04_06980 [Acidobacteriia bacterium]|nr:hypothetical protein [Terriglobia bacterium]